MKRTLLLLFLAVSLVGSAKTYYVAPSGGNDLYPGSKTQPWATWQRAFETAVAGDTVYFRGGVWYPKSAAYGNNITYISPDIQIGHNGEPGNPICFFNYPGESPVLDCRYVYTKGAFNTGLQIDDVHWINWKGLTIRNVYQRKQDIEAGGISGGAVSNMNWENMTLYNIGGHGWYLESDVGIEYRSNQLGWDGSGYIPYDTTTFKNCDTYQCADTFRVNSVNHPGNMGDGFKFINGGAYVTYEGCRAWYCADDGFDMPGYGVTVLKRCWSFINGIQDPSWEGNGFKFGANDRTFSSPRKILVKCIAAYNQTGQGFFDLEYDGYQRNKSRVYNCVSYKNESGFVMSNNTTYPNSESIYRNNIAYKSIGTDAGDRPLELDIMCFYTESNNNWDYAVPGSLPRWVYASDVTVTDADFVSLDQKELYSPRKSDGSLPDITLFNLVSTSDLIDKGVQIPASDNSGITLSYSGTAPDIGAFESAATNPNIKKVTSITVTGAGGLTTINADNGTLQLNAAVLPVDATIKTVTWSMSSGTDKAKVSTTGLVTALDNGIIVVKATANDGSGVFGTITITISNQVIPVTSIAVMGSGGTTTITVDNGGLQLNATVLPANATNKTVTWSTTTGADKVSISSNGLVTAIDDGTAVARAMANDGSGVFGYLVITISNQVLSVTNITVTGAGGAATITTDNGTLQLNATFLPENATNKAVTWSITNGGDKASISSTGIVTAIDNGTITARASANDGSGVYGNLSITILNQVIPVTGIAVTGENSRSLITAIGGTLQLNATVLPANATNKAVTWSITSGTDKAKISATGLVEALDNGTVVVRATANDELGIYGTITISISNQVIPTTNIVVTGSGGATAITVDNGTLQLIATILPANATNKTVTWSITSGGDKASISPTGIITAKDNGNVTARATANDGSGVFGTLTITIINQVNIVNSPPEIVVNFSSSSYSGFVAEINASGSYDSNKDNLTFTWVVPNGISVSSTTGSIIKYLGPVVSSSQKIEFTLTVNDGKTTQSRIIPIDILPYKLELEAAEISNIEASSYQTPFYPYNIIDGNIGTMWSASGADQWLIVELKHPFSIQHLKLAFQPGQKMESYFDILGSKDKISWEQILIKSASCAFSGDLQVFEFPLSKTVKEFNYVKLVGLGNVKDSWNYISELKIFGTRQKESPAYELLPVKIYPNPAKELVTIRIDESTLMPDWIKVIDMSGIVCFATEVDPNVREFSIPLNLKKGIYMIQLCSDRLTLFAQKLIIGK